MKVKELIAKLQEVDDNADIYIELSEDDCYREIEKVWDCLWGIALKAEDLKNK
jgi:hypothetical protein